MSEARFAPYCAATAQVEALALEAQVLIYPSTPSTVTPIFSGGRSAAHRTAPQRAVPCHASTSDLPGGWACGFAGAAGRVIARRGHYC